MTIIAIIIYSSARTRSWRDLVVAAGVATVATTFMAPVSIGAGVVAGAAAAAAYLRGPGRRDSSGSNREPEDNQNQDEH